MGDIGRRTLAIGGEYLLLSCALAASTAAASALTLLAVLSFGQLAQAATVNVTVKGEVLAKPKCEINDGNDISVPFGELNITDIDGVNYGKKKIPYSVSCSGDTSGMNGLMKVTLQGESPNFGTGLLRTREKEDLAIKLLLGNGQQLKLNEWLNFFTPITLSSMPYRSNAAAPRCAGGLFQFRHIISRGSIRR